MQNEYARDYYDNFLKDLKTDYKSARWFSSPEAQLDYDQTKRSIEWALGDEKLANALEIGPGDGVWTDLILPKVSKVTLLDQSIEMINRAKERLKKETKVTYINSDFSKFKTAETLDLIYAIRCFEYFEDKETAVKDFYNLLNPGGTLVLVTKNPQHIKMKKVQKRDLHTGQIDKKAMIKLLDNSGFSDIRVELQPGDLKQNIRHLGTYLNLCIDYIYPRKDCLNCPVQLTLLLRVIFMSHANNKIIVELYGSPGVGKSTLAKTLAEKYGFSLLTPVSVSRSEYVFILFRYLPVISFWLFLILKNFAKTKKIKLFRSNMSLLFLAFKKIHLARKSQDGLIVIDEGLVQRMLSYSDIIVTQKEMLRLLKISPLSSVVIFVNDREVVRDRYDTAHDRGSAGLDILNNWRKNLAVNLVTLSSIMANNRTVDHFETNAQSLESIINSMDQNKVDMI